jgi:transcriptional regulator NrdR family protein
MKPPYEYQSLCPFCPSGEVRVADSRITNEGWRIRRRMCMRCARRWTTYEIDADTLDALRTVQESMATISVHVTKIARALSKIGVDVDQELPTLPPKVGIQWQANRTKEDADE